MHNNIKKKPGPHPKDKSEKSVKISVSVFPEQIRQIINRGYAKEIDGRLHGLSKFTQDAYDIALKD